MISLVLPLVPHDPSGQDLLYLDKNADVGVSWRKAGPFERFSEEAGQGEVVGCEVEEVSGVVNRSVHKFMFAWNINESGRCPLSRLDRAMSSS